MFTIQFSNGKKLTGLTLNGNNYISPSLVPDSTFEGGLAAVQITDHETGEISFLYDAKLIQNTTYGGQSWFILAEKTEQDRLLERLDEIETALCELDEER